MNYAAGGVYIGDFVDGRSEGFGIYYTTDVASCEGWWLDGCINVYYVRTKANGDI